MAYFTYDQQVVLRAILTQIASETDTVFAAEIKEHKLLESLDKSSYVENTREDVYQVAESEDIQLTDEQELEIALIVIKRYDHSDYNEFISSIIEEVLNPEEEEEEEENKLITQATIEEIIRVSNHNTEESVREAIEYARLVVYPDAERYLDEGWTFENEDHYSILSDGKVVYFE